MRTKNNQVTRTPNDDVAVLTDLLRSSCRSQHVRRCYPSDAVNMAFSRRSHSSSSTISKRIPILLIAGANSAQSAFLACSEQMSNTERL